MTNEPELPPELQQLEEQLRGVKPAPLNEAFQRRLLDRKPSTRIRITLWLTAAAGLLAAVTAYWLVVQPASDQHQMAQPKNPTPVEQADLPPTWLVYTRAASESPEALDQLLSVHDRRLLQSAPALEKRLSM